MALFEKKPIFRAAALEKLSSPEQLDTLMQVTAPAGWLALSAVGLMLGVAVLWGIFGSIPNKVQGEGILIRGGAVLDVEANTAGRITRIDVAPGDLVTPGQIVATISQAGTDLKIANTKALLTALRADAIKYSAADRTNTQSQLLALAQERASRQAAIKNDEGQISALEEKLGNQEQLAAKGLVTQGSLIAARQAVNTAQQSLNANKVRLSQITAEEGNARKGLDQASSTRQKEIDQTERTLKELEGQLDATSSVVSPYAGRVLERVVDRGNLVNQGGSVITLETLDTPLKTVVFLPARDGKKVLKGMEVRIAPSSVKQEEFGFMIGRVEAVSSFPSTPEGMRRVLRNARLVEELAGRSAPVEMIAEITLDPGTASGFKWSSSKGPPTGVFSGTLCSATVVVSQKRPISYVIPVF